MTTNRVRVREIIAAHPTYTLADIARILRISRERVRQLATEEGISIRRGPRGAGETRERFVREHPLLAAADPETIRGMIALLETLLPPEPEGDGPDDTPPAAQGVVPEVTICAKCGRDHATVLMEDYPNGQLSADGSHT